MKSIGKFLGVDFNKDNHLENCYQLFFYANSLKKEISLIQTVHIDLFEMQMRNMNLNEIDRVIVNDYEDLGNFYIFKQFHNICMVHGCISQLKIEPQRNLILSHLWMAVFEPFLRFSHSIRRTDHIYHMRFMR